MADPLRSYTFVPWLRQGIGTKVDQPDTLGADPGPTGRLPLEVSVAVNGTPVTTGAELLGPGDVIGLNQRAVIRTEPRADTSDHEPNYFAFCEFYDEDLPWRYSPASATEHRLRPWLALVVATADEFDEAATGGPLGAVRFTADIDDLFPRPDQAWAWAHVQVHVDVTDDGTRSVDESRQALQRRLDRNPDLALSRLVCPRRLEPLTPYTAFVVPAFEVGRLAGVGATAAEIDAVGNQQPSWVGGDPIFPVYHRWEFGTGERGDFESLVRRLRPRPVPEEVGQRTLDVSRPEFGIRGLGDPGTVALEGALRRPGAEPNPATWPPSPSEFVDDLVAACNAESDRLAATSAGDDDGDPIIGPPIHGRWHAMIDRVDPTGEGWLNALNADPRSRAAAGVGAEVIRTEQEDLMARSWAQLGDIVEGNSRLRWAQVMLAANQRMFTRHLLTRTPADRVAVTAPVHQRIRVEPQRPDDGRAAPPTAGSAMTWRARLDTSRLTSAGRSSELRRVARNQGRISRHAAGAPARPDRPSALRDALVDGLATGELEAAPPRPPASGATSLDSQAAQLGPSWARPWLTPWLRRQRWSVLIALIVLTVVLAFVVWPIAVVSLVVAVGWAAFIRRYEPELRVADASSEDGLTSDAVDAVAPRPSFAITLRRGESPPAEPPSETGDDSAQAARFREAVRDLHLLFEEPAPAPPRRSEVDLDDVAVRLSAALDPAITFPRRLSTVVGRPVGSGDDPAQPGGRPARPIVPVMAHPVIGRPMYEPMADISAELMIPNLHLIAQDTASLLETNRPFIESYMVGLNHEMARELLWREFPTDQRGSYFRQFWDVADVVPPSGLTAAEWAEAALDIAPLHDWSPPSALGTHPNRSLPTGDDGRVVLLIRGQLLKRYRRTVIFAQRARWGPDPETGQIVRLLDDQADRAEAVRDPAFAATIEPDVRLVGFDLTAEQVRGSTDPNEDPGWFFVLQERPGETRFGLDLPPADGSEPPPIESWDDLAWPHIGTPPGRPLSLEPAPPTSIVDDPDAAIGWGTDAAAMAYILYQSPVMVALHASDMLADADDDGPGDP